MYKFYIFFISIFVFYACNTEENKVKNSIKTNKSISTNKIERRWFENIKKDSSNVLFIVLDPHGDALLAKNILKPICNDFNINMISPYTVKNNSFDYIRQIDLCIKQYPQENQQIYLVGFSGGAKMAFQYAIRHSEKVKGLIMCGAGIGKLIKKTLPFPLVMIAGEDDFNMIEQYYSPFDAQILKNSNVISLIFNGKHEWPDSSILKLATEFVFSKSSILKLNKNKIWSKYKNAVKNNNALKSYKYLEMLYKNNPKDKQVYNGLKEILQNKSFQKEIIKFESILQTEQKRNQILTQNLYDKDFVYWRTKINKINKIISDKNNPNSTSYTRTKAFLGVATYSLCQREIQNPQSNQIQKLLEIYELLEPNNKEMLRMKEIISR